MALRATCCGRILSLITRLPRFTGDERLIGLSAKQPGEQSNRPFLNVRRQHLKVRAEWRGGKKGRLGDTGPAGGPRGDDPPAKSNQGCVGLGRRSPPPSATKPFTPHSPAA